jgi:hypothetical protein
MAEIDSPVKKVIEVEIVTMRKVGQSPTWPTTQPKRKYIITPRIVKIEGVNTPPKVPNPEDSDVDLDICKSRFLLKDVVALLSKILEEHE